MVWLKAYPPMLAVFAFILAEAEPVIPQGATTTVIGSLAACMLAAIVYIAKKQADTLQKQLETFPSIIDKQQQSFTASLDKRDEMFANALDKIHEEHRKTIDAILTATKVTH